MGNGRQGIGAKLLCAALAASFVYALSSGIRSSLAAVIVPLTVSNGLSYAQVSSAVAVGQFAYGLSQVLFGALALRLGVRAVLLWGCALMISGLALVPWCTGALSLTLALGLLFHSGTGACCFGMLWCAITPLCRGKAAALAAGIVSAGCGAGTLVFSPLMGILGEKAGAGAVMAGCAAALCAAVPACLYVTAHGREDRGAKTSGLNARAVLGAALLDRAYLLLIAAFCVCGFHMGIIQTHFYSQLLSDGLSAAAGSAAYAVIGVATSAGALWCAALCARHGDGKILSSIYLVRACLAVAIVLLPGTPAVLFAAALLLGLSMDASVAPTSQLISARLGPQTLSVTFGFAYLSHQAGGFLSAYLGGVFVQCGAGYGALWALDSLLCLTAAVAVMLCARPSQGALRLSHA
jgi:predicted MFS family arabinose efflux permease